MNHDHVVELRAPGELRPYARNARKHSKRQIKQIAASIKRFGFTNPILITDDNEIIAGHGRCEAAKLLGSMSVPVIRLSNMSEADRKAYIIADNKLALNAGWDMELLAIELQTLIDIDFDIELTGFSIGEVELVLDHAAESDPANSKSTEDEVPLLTGLSVSRRGDLWDLGRHRMICGDARSPGDYTRLLKGGKAQLAFTDPPYNVRIDGNVTGLGKVKHREFAMASGEMSEEEFAHFLKASLGAMAAVCSDGAIAYVCMDWRHAGELIAVGKSVFSELKQLCVWNKTNGGMGTFYRSKHELVFVFKVGTAPHTNTFGLGDSGRYRTNVWDYPGISSMGGERDEALAMHPTVKPVALVADAIRDCSKRGQIVLDPFAGSGTTLIAAESCGRIARLIEYDPLYCDTIIRRFERFTSKAATLHGDGRTFEEIERARGQERAA